MQCLLIPVAAFIIFFLVKKVKDLTGTEPAVLYIILGIIIGIVLDLTGAGNITQVFKGIEKYNSVALLFMFFTAGFSINIKQLKSSGKTTAKLLSIPAYAESLIIGGIIFLALKLMPGLELSFVESLIVSSIFAVSSAANVIPVCMNMIQSGRKGPHNIPGTMIVVSVVDGFITVPVVFVSIILLLTQNSEHHISIGKIPVLVVLTLACIVLALMLGLILGRIELFMIKGGFKKLSRPGQSRFADFTLILFAFFIAFLMGLLLYEVDAMKEMVSIFGILIMCGMGMAIKNYDRTGAAEIIGTKGNLLFRVFGMPVIFIYVGAIIDLKTFMNPLLIGLLLGITLLAVVIKGYVASAILKGDKYTKEEINFAKKCFIPKGVSLINFSVLFSEILKNNENLISFMAMLAAVGILSTMTAGLPMMRKAGERIK